jgi:tRNA-Thr(GGU) m(6)t(6)A37 methyltransferase TsaA
VPFAPPSAGYRRKDYRGTGRLHEEVAPEVTLRPIGYVVTAHDDPESTPTQAPGDAEGKGELVVLPEFIAGLRGLEGFDYAWLISWFDRLADEPARLEEVPHALRDTGQTFGVFATRSPARPNHLGLSLVRVLSIDGARMRFAGVDLLDHTPVLDIKPFIPQIDIPPEGAAARSGWIGELGGT